jgi:hypothetical protein
MVDIHLEHPFGPTRLLDLDLLTHTVSDTDPIGLLKSIFLPQCNNNNASFIK